MPRGQMIVQVVRIKSYVVMGLASAMIKMGLNVYANRYVCFFFFSIFGKTIAMLLKKYLNNFSISFCRDGPKIPLQEAHVSGM